MNGQKNKGGDSKKKGTNGFPLRWIALVFLLLTIGLVIHQKNTFVSRTEELPPTLDQDTNIVDGIHTPTGLIVADGFTEVVNNCTTCHSAQLIIQNRMGREAWVSTIRWMQETQNLWDLGAQEEIILSYLTANYPPKKTARRQPLQQEEWYPLE